MTVDGGTDYAVFEAFVGHVVVPEIRRGDVVVWDNLKAHYSPRAKQMIEEAGGRIIFLPPYSPELNPIELAFSKLKKLIRDREPRTRQALDEMLAYLMSELTSQDAIAWFKHCGYRTSSF
jgi:transposase